MKPGFVLSAALTVLALTVVGAQAPAPAVQSGVTFQGNGQNIVHVDWDNDVIVVVRWLGGTRVLDQFPGEVLAALEP